MNKMRDDASIFAPVKEYIRFARTAIPTYDEFFIMADQFLTTTLNESANLLIVGAGGGIEVVKFSENHPSWSFTGVDPSAGMIYAAEHCIRSAHVESTCQLVLGEVEDLQEDVKYDAATCFLVLHLLNQKDKQKLIEEVAKRLKPNAPFLISAMFGETVSPSFQHNIKAWRHHMVELGMPLPQVIQQTEQIRRETHLIPEQEMIGLLHQCGFADTFRFYQSYHFGGWITYRKH
jgi:tRNA (cmo5U34)-methyltransferase